VTLRAFVMAWMAGFTTVGAIAPLTWGGVDCRA
jgi:hypothetical protein